MRVLSLFDGMSCGQIALKEIGITPEVYYASEIDKFAIKQTQLNFPNTIQVGDVRDLNVEDLGRIDLILAGSPCTDMSFSGKRKGLSTVEGIEVKSLNEYLELKKQGFEFAGSNTVTVKGKYTYDLICVAMRGRNPEKPTCRESGLKTVQMIEFKNDGKSNCLTTVQKDNLIFQIPRGFNKGGFHEDKAPTLSCNSYDRNNFIIQRVLHGDFRIRRLTPTECSRLQTVPDWYKWECSETQQYKMLGNGWTIKVIEHILKRIKE